MMPVNFTGREPLFHLYGGCSCPKPSECPYDGTVSGATIVHAHPDAPGWIQVKRPYDLIEIYSDLETEQPENKTRNDD